MEHFIQTTNKNKWETQTQVAFSSFPNRLLLGSILDTTFVRVPLPPMGVGTSEMRKEKRKIMLLPNWNMIQQQHNNTDKWK